MTLLKKWIKNIFHIERSVNFVYRPFILLIMIVKNDPEILQDYLHDASNFKGHADEVYIPLNFQELKQIISDLYTKKIPYTVSGAGTGLTGGRVPLEGVIISMENLNKILDIDYNKGLIRIQTGLTLENMESELNSHGYFFPPNPTERNASIGGNIANNASGSRTFKYGPYRNHIKELKILLANGDEIILSSEIKSLENNIITLHSKEGNVYKIPITPIKLPDTKNAAGYYLSEDMRDMDLFIGSEGTLGIIAEATLEFMPLPESTLGIMAFFDDVDNMLKYVENVRGLSAENNKIPYQNTKDISARLIEYFDENSLNILRDKYPQLPEKAKACIWTEQEYVKENETALLDRWYSMIAKYTKLVDSTWISLDESGHEKFRIFRHSIPATIVDIVARNNYPKMGTDTAVPVDNFKKFFTFIVDNFKKTGIDFAIWGHIGNAHLHANLLPKSQEEFDKSSELFKSILQYATQLGGTISGEHGIGKLKKQYMHMMFSSEEINAMKTIKKTLDPYNLLGRGNLFDLD